MRHLPVVSIYGYTNLVYNYNTWNSKEGERPIQQSFMFSPKKLYFSNQWRSITVFNSRTIEDRNPTPNIDVKFYKLGGCEIFSSKAF